MILLVEVTVFHLRKICKYVTLHDKCVMNDRLLIERKALAHLKIFHFIVCDPL